MDTSRFITIWYDAVTVRPSKHRRFLSLHWYESVDGVTWCAKSETNYEKVLSYVREHFPDEFVKTIEAANPKAAR